MKMNSYAYFGMDQPAAPPRRKRSLSTSRGDYGPISQDYSGTPFQSNRIGRRNFSTDHIPGGYAYSGVTKPLGMSYGSSTSQQALSNYGNYNGYANYNTKQPFQNAKVQNIQQIQQFGSPLYPGGMQQPLRQQSGLQHGSHQQLQLQQNQLMQQQQFQQQQLQLQQQQQRRQPPYNSYGSNLNHLGNSMQAVEHAPMPIPRFMNPYAVQSAKVPPVRAHQDYLKYAQPNVHYNPYQSQFSPTLMARPDIRALQKPEVVPTFQKRDRSPFSSREQLDHLPQTPTSPLSPQRPPPPKGQSSGRLSVENLATPSASDYEAHLSSQLRDRRSVSPTRFSPATQMLQNQQQQQQRPYSRHSTSPLPSSNNLQDRYSDNRFGSRSSLNSPNSGYVSPRLASSRESSPFARPVSPFGRPSSPFTSSYGLSNKTRSYSSGLSSSRKYDRSISYGTSSITSASNNSNRYDRSISAESASGRFLSTTQLASTKPDIHDDKTELDARNNDQDNTMSVTEQSSSSPNSSQQNNSQNMMDSLQVPGTPNDSPLGMSPQNRQSPQYSEAFTDHCDQYKSVTSKILAKNNKNRNSGEFGEVFNELQQHLQDQQQLSQNGFDEFGFERTTDRAVTPERKIDPYAEEKKVLENQLFNSPPISRVTSRNNSLAFDNFGSPTSSRKNSNSFEPFRKSPTPSGQTSRRNSASAAASRKGSLPSDYLAHPDTFALSNEWSREKVANLAHEARQRAHNPPGNDALKKVGVWFTKQFVFLLIAGVNILIAYAFYNLFTMLPADI